MSELEQYITTYFEGIEASELQTVASSFHPSTLKKGDFFLLEGKVCDKLSFIHSGILRLYKTMDNGKEVTQWISTQGYFVTELSGLLFNTPARWSIQALTEVELFTIDKCDYNALNQQISR